MLLLGGGLDSFRKVAVSANFANFPVTLGALEDERVEPPCKGGVDDLETNPIEDGNGNTEGAARVEVGMGDVSLEYRTVLGIFRRCSVPSASSSFFRVAEDVGRVAALGVGGEVEGAVRFWRRS